MIVAPIDRNDKNLMRRRLEEILQMHVNIVEKIAVFAEDTKPPVYKELWCDLKSKNDENIRHISRTMVIKCNR